MDPQPRWQPPGGWRPYWVSAIAAGAWGWIVGTQLASSLWGWATLVSVAFLIGAAVAFLNHRWDSRRRRHPSMQAKWVPPRLAPGDYLIEAEVVQIDGRHDPIVLIAHPRDHGGAEMEGYSRPLDLDPGASVRFPLP